MADDREDRILEELRALFEQGAGTVVWEELPVELWQYMIYDSTVGIEDFTSGDFLSLILSGPRIRDALLLPGNEVDLAKARAFLDMEDNVVEQDYRALFMGVNNGRYDPYEVYSELSDVDNTANFKEGSTQFRLLEKLILKILALGVTPDRDGLYLGMWMGSKAVVDAHAGVTIRNRVSLLIPAALGNFVYGMQFLLQHPDVTAEDLNEETFPDDQSVILLAIEAGAWDVVLLLLNDNRVGLFVDDINGDTPWSSALKRNPPYAVFEAFAARPDLDTTADIDGVPPFAMALMHGVGLLYVGFLQDRPPPVAYLNSVAEGPLPDKILYMMDTVGPQRIKTYITLAQPQLVHADWLDRPLSDAVRTAFFWAVVREADRRIDAQRFGQGPS